jgi:hypothetical protein
MINTIQSENENLFPSPLLSKLEDPGVPSIHCSINQWNFQRAVYDMGWSINLMSKVTYELIYDDLPLYATYIMIFFVTNTTTICLICRDFMTDSYFSSQMCIDGY